MYRRTVKSLGAVKPKIDWFTKNSLHVMTPDQVIGPGRGVITVGKSKSAEVA